MTKHILPIMLYQDGLLLLHISFWWSFVTLATGRTINNLSRMWNLISEHIIGYFSKLFNIFSTILQPAKVVWFHAWQHFFESHVWCFSLLYPATIVFSLDLLETTELIFPGSNYKFHVSSCLETFVLKIIIFISVWYRLYPIL